MPVYLDHNATAPLHPVVARSMQDFASRFHGNPSSAHRAGQEARSVLDGARRTVRDLVGGGDGDLLFVGSGTEAVLLGVVGAAESVSPQGRHLVLSRIEHTAGLDAARILTDGGASVTWVSPDSHGRVDPAAVARAMTPETVLVSVMHANNETGVIQPVSEIAALCREQGVLYHVDAVQSVGKIPVTAAEWGADLVSVAAHKMGGPAGVGALWKRHGVAVRPLLPGTQEHGVRGGTHNLIGIHGFAEAAGVAMKNLDADALALKALRDGLERRMVADVPTAVITGSKVSRLPNTTHLTLDPRMGPDLVMALDLDGFAVSSGSACRAGSSDPSHVLLAMGISPRRAQTALRVSLGPSTQPEDLEALVLNLARRVASPGVRPAGARS